MIRGLVGAAVPHRGVVVEVGLGDVVADGIAHGRVSDVQATRESWPRFVLLGKGVLLTYRGQVGIDIPVRTTTITPRR